MGVNQQQTKQNTSKAILQMSFDLSNWLIDGYLTPGEQ